MIDVSYDLTPSVKLGGRFEWFRDDDGVRLGLSRPSNPNNNPFVGDMYSLSLGVNWMPCCDVTLRPEVRWDWFEGTGAPFNDGADTDEHGIGPLLDAMTAREREQLDELGDVENDPLVVVNGFSKAWAMTGWRIGWVVTPLQHETWHPSFPLPFEELRHVLSNVLEHSDRRCNLSALRFPRPLGFPGDDKRAVPSNADRRSRLIVVRKGVHQEFVTGCGAVG